MDDVSGEVFEPSSAWSGCSPHIHTREVVDNDNDKKRQTPVGSSVLLDRYRIFIKVLQQSISVSFKTDH
jgi:hypothetical protein